MNSALSETEKKKIIRRRMLTACFVFVALVLFDQITKGLAVTYLKGKEDIILIPGVLQFSYVENAGAAFGSMQNMRFLLIVLPLFVLGGILYCLWKMPKTGRHFFMFITLLVLAAGALGNLIDRFRHAYVVDFIYFSLIDFPVFNVADIYVTCSALVLVLLMLFYYKEEDTAFLHRGEEPHE